MRSSRSVGPIPKRALILSAVFRPRHVIALCDGEPSISLAGLMVGIAAALGGWAAAGAAVRRAAGCALRQKGDGVVTRRSELS